MQPRHKSRAFARPFARKQVNMRRMLFATYRTVDFITSRASVGGCVSGIKYNTSVEYKMYAEYAARDPQRGPYF